MKGFLRKPPYGISRWEWYIEPRLTAIRWRLTGRCTCCGTKRPGHKLACSYRGVR